MSDELKLDIFLALEHGARSTHHRYCETLAGRECNCQVKKCKDALVKWKADPAETRFLGVAFEAMNIPYLG